MLRNVLEVKKFLCFPNYQSYRKVAYDVTHFAPKNWLTKSSNLCCRGIGRTPTFGVILKTNQKLFKIWNELLLVGFSETNKFDQKQFG